MHWGFKYFFVAKEKKNALKYHKQESKQNMEAAAHFYFKWLIILNIAPAFHQV